MYKYKSVPFTASVADSDKEASNTVAVQLEKSINENSIDGWEFHSICDVKVEATSGCFGMILGRKATQINSVQLIFRKAAK